MPLKGGMARRTLLRKSVPPEHASVRGVGSFVPKKADFLTFSRRRLP